MACIGGRFVGIECKANGGKPTKLQVKNLKDIADKNGLAIVVDETSIGTFELYLHVELEMQQGTPRKGRLVDLTASGTSESPS